MLVACYGSLKKGFYNHRVLGEYADFLGKSSVWGVMYWNGSYPKLYKVENDDYDSPFRLPLEKKHELEVYRISDNAFDRINAMELGAGYVAETVETEWGLAMMYWMPHEHFDEADTWIGGYTQELFDNKQ